MKKDIKLVAMDIDGTLIGKNKYMTDYTRSILKKSGEKGIHLVIASGRAFGAIPKMLLNIEGMEYVITSNGSSIFRIEDKKRIYGKDLDKNQVEELLEFYKKQNVPMEVFVQGEAYASKAYYEHPEIYGASPTAVEYVHTTRTPVEDLENFVLENIKHIEGINFIVNDLVKKEQMRKELEKMSNIYVTSSVPRYIEVSHGDVCKRNAIQWLAAYLNVDRGSIAAFGDGENDIEMIEYAGYGVAMGNAVDSLKAICDRVALTVEEDGVARVIEEFFEEKFTEILGMGIELTSKDHYNYVIMVCTCDRPKEETWKIIEIKNRITGKMIITKRIYRT